MLTRAERGEVEGALAVAFAAQTDPRGLVKVIFKTEADGLLVSLPFTVVDATSFAQRIVGDALESRWNCTPALLELLLDYLVESRGLGDFGVILHRVRRQGDPNPSPFDAAWLSTDRPFIDRDDLRSRVESLVQANARPLLRVTPVDGGFGCSYSCRYLEHLEDAWPGDTHVLLAELSPGTAPSYDVWDLADSFRSQLGVSEAIPTRNESSYPKAIARWILRHIMCRGDRWIIALDGFGEGSLKPEVRETIESLAALVPSGQYRRRVRLVLLDYPDDLPSVSSADVLEEFLQPTANLTVMHLMPCIREWDAQRRAKGERGLRSAEHVRRIADGLIARAPSAGKERLEFLNQALSDLHNYEPEA